MGQDAQLQRGIQKRRIIYRGIYLLRFRHLACLDRLFENPNSTKKAEIVEQRLFTERFSKATKQLGNSQLTVQFGGICALWRLAEDSGEKAAKSVFNILCAFVRKPMPDPSLSNETAKLEDANAEEFTQINLNFLNKKKQFFVPTYKRLLTSPAVQVQHNGRLYFYTTLSISTRLIFVERKI